MSKQKYRLTYDTDKAKWDAFVERSPQGSVFSETWYLDALNVKFKTLSVLNNNDEIVAGIVLAKNHINTWSNPMLDKYLGILLSEEQTGVSQKTLSTQFIIMELLANELKKKYTSFDYYFHPNFKNWTSLYWKGFNQQTRYTYRIDLKKDIKIIWNSFHTNTKRNINNALKRNVKIQHKIDSESFFSIINETYIRQGSKAPFVKQNFIRSYDKLKNIDDKFVSIGAFNEKQEIISVCGLICDKNSSYLILNGINVENEIRGANALIIYEAIKHIKEKGIDFFDFEGSMLPGVEQFYRRFGGDLVPYYRIWNDNFFNYFKTKAKRIYKKYKYGR